MAFSLLYDRADYVRESFIWCWRRAKRPPRPLPEDYHILCLRFSLPEAERVAADFELPEILQVTFYTMLLNEAVELSVVRGFMADGLKSSLVGLNELCQSRTERSAASVTDHCSGGPSSFGQSGRKLEIKWDPSTPGPRSLPSVYHSLCPHFDLGVVTRYAHDSNTLEMV
ncbi:hypothetical protein Cgig2_016561 [Carnegiea gigantea]|uniref:Uncharacterized protein n=1 Tax=Carnegiea gigantea TaxID=171969 RepID=A0A9Q1QTR2_9CARY|nr:hypothetical protein Cgig2_016561 [Carnegiea gigantea]